MSEVWINIPDYEGLYKCSNYGRIKRTISNRCVKERILKGSVHRGYLMVTLSKNAVHDRRMIHRIVAGLFLHNPEWKPLVNHLDSNPTNNKVENLEWCTQSENIQHSFKTHNRLGENSPMGILKDKQVLEIRTLYASGNYTETNLADRFNMSRGCINSIVSRKTWTHL